MNFDFSDDAKMLKDQARKFLTEKCSTKVVRKILESDEPYDKAGGYGIQGRAAVFVEHLTGSYTNVVGLPLFETAALLERCGVSLWSELQVA